MPALVLNTDLRPTSSSDASSTSGEKRSESPTSDRPPVSPITPTTTVAQLAPLERSDSRPRNEPPPRPAPAPAPAPAPTTFRQQPPSVPISESENPDAIALRSAISLLQIQREKSKRDLKALEELKHAAVQDPEAFVRSLQEQRAKAAGAHNDILTPTLAGLTDAAMSNDDEGGAGRKDSVNTDSKAAPRFPAIPQPQNVVRCPPIEWAKYHIVGEPLNKMHEEQKKWPGSSEPPKLGNGHRAPPHSVAAPYSPFKDAVGSKSKSPSTGPSSKTKKTPS
ncbi:hypothetical protein N0V87_000644 [Didymella glomerata]|jgi:hypothetical protein|uniref:Uncharacterized protein n=1 Tax=Didymella glomerata TaxID=749621 RepID=A0A9W8X7E9_9PLEO|nr:hypothetical protein N0V87_000644 [Didymella glomerata]